MTNNKNILQGDGMGRVPLHKLRFGHEYPGADINSRVAGREDEIAQLAASIINEGLLQSLLVIAPPEKDDTYFVVDGNRRLAALQLLKQDGHINDNDLVCAILTDDTNPIDALRKSLIANDIRLPLHPVDRHAAFAQCVEKGQNVADIAAEYVTDERTVKKALALGRLAPTIRSDWRRGVISAETAQAFTLIEGHEKQTRLYKKLSKAHGERLDGENVREEIGAIKEGVAANLAFVGREAFEAAGGQVIEDLFGFVDKWNDEEDREYTPVVSDSELLARLADEKLKEACDQLLAEGWSWAALAKDLPQGWNWHWEKLQGASDKQKAKSGCVVKLLDNGSLEITCGVVKPDNKVVKEQKAKKKAVAKANGEIVDEIPVSLEKDMVEQKTRAAAQAMIGDTHVALAAMIAGFMAGYSPVCIDSEGLGNNSKNYQDFADAFEHALKMSEQVQIRTLAHIAAQSLDFRRGQPEETNILIAALDSESFNTTMSHCFAMADYFERIPKEIALRDIEEALGKDAVKPLLNKKKQEIAAFALAELAKLGWLPSQLRSVHYTPPGGKQKAPAKKEKKKGGRK